MKHEGFLWNVESLMMHCKLRNVLLYYKSDEFEKAKGKHPSAASSGAEKHRDAACMQSSVHFPDCIIFLDLIETAAWRKWEKQKEKHSEKYF